MHDDFRKQCHAKNPGGTLMLRAFSFPFGHQVDGVRRATPLLLVLVCVELSDIVFAVDSIPAVFAVTKASGSYHGSCFRDSFW